MGKALISYAADTNLSDQNSDTNIDNVKFDVYFDATNKSKKEIEKDINSGDLQLFVSVEVRDGGYLTEGQIEFSNCNFKLKNNENKIELDSIQSGKNKEFFVDIMAKKDDLFDLNLLDMVSQIKLTGEYINNKGEKEKVETTKQVKISWTAENITDENNPIKLNQKVITNKIYNVGGTNKRVIQLAVTSGIEKNQYPIKSTEIELNVPKLGELYPEKVVVASYDTIATNGKNSTEFEKVEENETEKANKSGKWTYKKDEHKVNITVNNEAVENKVSWAKSGEDKFVVTYIYAENANLANVTSTINSKISLYETKNAELTKTSEIKKENMEEMGDAITVDVTGQDVIYKSNMNIGKDTEFEVDWTIEVGCSEIVQSLAFGNYPDELVLKNEDSQEEKDAITYYKSTYINKAEFLKIFGEEGEIYFNYPDSEGNIVVLKTIDNETIPDENGNIRIDYPEKISTLLIQTTNPISEGKLNVKHNKTLDKSSYTTEEIEKINKLNSQVALEAYNYETAKDGVLIVELDNAVQINMQEPKTVVEIGVDKENLSTTQNNNVNITVTLKEDDLKYKLYKNPVIEIELPEEVENIKVEEPTILNEAQTGLTIKNKEVTENDNGNKVIKITLEGEQTEYIGQDIQILVNADLQIKKLMPTVREYIKVKCTNDEEIAQNSCSVKFIAEQGMLLANSISNYNNTEPEIEVFKKETKTGLLSAQGEAVTAIGKSTIINNTGDNLQNVIIIGENTAQIKMSDAEVYYTKDAKVSLDSNWIQEYSDDITGYKVVLHSLEIGEVVEIPYDLKIPAKLGTDKNVELKYTVYNETNKLEESPIICLQTEQAVKLSLEVEPTVENGEDVYEGSTLSYNIKVTNTGDTTARNIQINNPVPDGATLIEGTSTLTIEELESGKSVTKTIQIKVNTLPEGEKEKKITNTTIVTALYLEKELKSTITNTVKKAEIIVDIADYYGDGANIYENGQLKYKTTIENVSNQDIKNIEIISNIPEGTKYVSDAVIGYKKIITNEFFNIEEIEDFEFTKKEEGNKIVYNINNLKPNSQIVILLELTPNSLEENESEKIITYEVEVKADQIDRYVVKKSDTVIKPKITMSHTSINKTEKQRTEYVNAGDILEYTTVINNESNYNQAVVIEGKIPTQLKLKSLKYSINNEEDNDLTVDGGEYYLEKVVNANKTAKIVLIAEVEDINSDNDVSIADSISCRAKIYDRGGFGENIYVCETTDSIEYKIKGIAENTENPANEENPSSPENPVKPEDPTNPKKEEKTYKISGIAWLDENENGKQEGTEKLLKGITVKIKDVKTKKYLKDEDGDNIIATTNENGIYEFKGIKAGKYAIEFEYDKATYKLTPQKGKDSVANVVTTGENTIITTDTIIITSKDISNVNIGLCLNPIYDLKLDKYVSKITVQNSAGTKVYNYNKEQLAKVDIKAKKLAGSTVIIEYTIEVTNNGEVPGYAKTIADYLSPELKFNSELNTSWYQGTDNNLYCVELADDIINPGESKQVKLILTKAMTANNTGLVNNTAEIYEDFNEYALKDINSVAGNKEKKENDMSSADVIITVSTGSPILYIGIIIGSMLLLGLGIYLINKKVIMRKVI